MATNMDKALYEAPQGLDQLGAMEEPIEIEIEDPEAVRIRAGDVEIEIEPTEDDDEFSKNLAEDIPDLPVS
jgi:leucyl aminopeptidase (aminopeptidase T)